jgi:hypothetical protein
MPTSTIELSTQHKYEQLLAEEKRLREIFVQVRDSGEASQKAIDLRYNAFAHAIDARADHKKKFPHVKETL